MLAKTCCLAALCGALLMQLASAAMVITLSSSASRSEELTFILTDDTGNTFEPSEAYYMWCGVWPLDTAPNSPTPTDIAAAPYLKTQEITSSTLFVTVTVQHLPVGLVKGACFNGDDVGTARLYKATNGNRVLPIFNITGSMALEGGIKAVAMRTDGAAWPTNGFLGCAVAASDAPVPTTQTALRTWWDHEPMEVTTAIGGFKYIDLSAVTQLELEFTGLQGLTTYSLMCGLQDNTNGLYYTQLQRLELTTTATTPIMFTLSGGAFGKVTVNLRRKDYANFAGRTEDSAMCLLHKTSYAFPPTIAIMLSYEYAKPGWDNNGYLVTVPLSNTTNNVDITFQPVAAFKWRVTCAFAQKNGGGVVTSAQQAPSDYQVNQVAELAEQLTSVIVNRTAFSMSVVLTQNYGGLIRCVASSPRAYLNMNFNILWSRENSYDRSVVVIQQEATGLRNTVLFADMTHSSRYQVACSHMNGIYIQDEYVVRFPCAAGKGAVSGGDDDGICNACVVGKFATGTSDTQAPCLDCPAGKTGPVGANSTAMCCGNNATYSGASKSCECFAGQAMAADGSCSRCPANTYISAGACVNCPANSNTTAGSTSMSQCICGGGYEMREGLCAQCPAGKFRKPAATNTNCTWCLKDTYAPDMGRADDCLACPVETLGGYERVAPQPPNTCYCPNAQMEWIPITDLQPTSTCISKHYSGAMASAELARLLIAAMVLLATCGLLLF